MKNQFAVLTFLLLIFNINVFAQDITVSSDQEAEFFLDGQSQGNRSTISFKLNKKRPSVVVTIKKSGYVPVERKYSNLYGKPVKTDYIKLVEDEAYKNSVEGDFANKNISVETSMPLDEAWRYLAMISRQYFEVLEKSDKDTGFMQSAWYIKKYNYYTVRQRFTASQVSINPLIFSIKIDSEIASNDKNNKDDESYEKWDRVLKGQADMFSELQTRMRKK